MTILFDKAEQSLESAAYLHDDEKYSSSIHCSYYSCVQMMRHILFNLIPKPYNEIEFDKLKQVRDEGSHNFLIMKLSEMIKGSKTIDLIRKADTFSRDLHDLKKLRKKADYNQVRIFEKDSKIAKSLASNNLALLKEVFI